MHQRPAFLTRGGLATNDFRDWKLFGEAEIQLLMWVLQPSDMVERFRQQLPPPVSGPPQKGRREAHVPPCPGGVTLQPIPKAMVEGRMDRMPRNKCVYPLSVRPSQRCAKASYTAREKPRRPGKWH